MRNKNSHVEGLNGDLGTDQEETLDETDDLFIVSDNQYMMLVTLNEYILHLWSL